MKERVVWIDFLKGFLLVLTCSSHFMERPEVVDAVLVYVPTFFVPMFFVLSGYLCKPLQDGMTINGGGKLLLKKKVKMLLIPYLFFSAFALLHAKPSEFLSMIYQTIYTGSSCGIATPMWFVGTLLVVSIIFTPIIWLIQRNNRKLMLEFLFLVILFFVWYLVKDIRLSLPWHIKGLPFYGILFVGGALIRMQQHWLNTISFGAIMIVFVIGILGFFIPISGTPLAPICPFAITFVIICVAGKFESVRKIRFPILEWVSINGLIILGAHNFLYRYFHVVANNIPAISTNETLFFVYSFITVYITLYFIVVPLMNTLCYRILGKKKMSWRESYIKTEK